MHFLLIVVLVVLAAMAQAVTFPARDKFPQVIAHRGASGYVPEHSLAGYRLAMDMGTDYIEPDLCISKDGVFVALHDLLLDDTTNVNTFPEFADRKRTQEVDGKVLTGFFVSDFTLAELKSLRLKQRLAGRSTLYNYLLQIPTFDEILSLVQSEFNTTGVMTGIYPELKHPSYFADLGYKMDDMLLEKLSSAGYIIKGENTLNNMKQVVPVIIQCFDASTLMSLRQKTDLPLIYLIDKPYANIKSYFNPDSLKNVSTFADGLGPEKSFFETDSLAEARANVQMAHDNNLMLHPFTFRADSGIDPKFNGSFEAEEMYFYCCLGIDGVFSEFPDRTRETIDVYSKLSLPPVDQRTICGTLTC